MINNDKFSLVTIFSKMIATNLLTKSACFSGRHVANKKGAPEETIDLFLKEKATTFSGGIWGRNSGGNNTRWRRYIFFIFNYRN